MKYQSEILKEIIDKEGHITSLLHYESECIEHAINEMDEGVPIYQGELLNNYLYYIDHGIPIISVNTVSNGNIKSSHNDKNYTYDSMPTYTGSMSPSNLFDLYIGEPLIGNQQYKICFNQLTTTNTKMSVKDNNFNTLGQETTYSAGNKEIIFTPNSQINNFISLRIESIEDTRQRHFEWYNIKIYKL